VTERRCPVLKNKANTHKPKKQRDAAHEETRSKKFTDNQEKKANKYGVVPILMDEELEEDEDEFEQEY
jgi:hypothetical protein